MGAKNLHLEHLEDEIINQGIDGGRGAINFLQGLRDMLKGNSNSGVNMTVKWDGRNLLSFVDYTPKLINSLLQRNHSLTKNPNFTLQNQKSKMQVSYQEHFRKSS